MALDRLESLQQREIDYWRQSEHESPDSDSVYNLVNKMSDVPVFMEVLQRYQAVHFKSEPMHLLELGGGQGWSACLVKRLFPQVRVTLTDISSFAIQSAHKWETVFQVRLDAAYACSSFAINEPDDSVDIVYCFAAAHHFRAHRQTLKELHRILRPGGVALYLYEPVCPRFLYSFAYRRINRGRPEIEEDILVWRKLLAIAGEVGLEGRIDFHPSTLRRRPVAGVYYALLSRLTWLCRHVPCSANFVFRKPALAN
jgi:SAM-dependent methyltransferase